MKLAQQVGKELKAKEDKLGTIIDFEAKIRDLETLIELIEGCSDEEGKEFFDELVKSLQDLFSKKEELRIETMLNGKYDSSTRSSCIAETISVPPSSAYSPLLEKSLLWKVP